MAKGNNWHLPVRMWGRVGRLYPAIIITMIIMMAMINVMTMIILMTMIIMMSMIIMMMIMILGDHHEDVVSS